MVSVKGLSSELWMAIQALYGCPFKEPLNGHLKNTINIRYYQVNVVVSRSRYVRKPLLSRPLPEFMLQKVIEERYGFVYYEMSPKVRKLLGTFLFSGVFKQRWALLDFTLQLFVNIGQCIIVAAIPQHLFCITFCIIKIHVYDIAVNIFSC